MSAQAPERDAGELPLRVSTLEIFFDLVYAFTLTQLTAMLADELSWRSALQVLLIFGLLWWMYGAYAWLTNARPPVHTTERLLLLVGMAGFLIIGLAIPAGFGRGSRGTGVAAGCRAAAGRRPGRRSGHRLGCRRRCGRIVA